MELVKRIQQRLEQENRERKLAREILLGETDFVVLSASEIESAIWSHAATQSGTVERQVRVNMGRATMVCSDLRAVMVDAFPLSGVVGPRIEGPSPVDLVLSVLHAHLLESVLRGNRPKVS